MTKPSRSYEEVVAGITELYLKVKVRSAEEVSQLTSDRQLLLRSAVRGAETARRQ